MKRIRFNKNILTIMILVLFILPLWAKDELNKEQMITRVVLQVLDKHYSQQKLDDNFSKKIFDHFLKSLDYSKRFFLKTDIQKLQQFKTRIDDELLDNTDEFFVMATNILNRRANGAQAMVKEILSRPFDFTADESVEVDPDKRDYCKNSGEWEVFWKKMLKYEVLNRYIEVVSSDKTYSNKNTGQFQPKAEAQARKDIDKNWKRIFERRLKDKDQYNRYLNAVAESFDPHTSYFPPQEKEDFDIQMTGTFEGIGAHLKEDGDFIKVQDIIPGSPAWRQKDLKAGDIILKVAQGDRDPVDIVSMPVNDAVKIIRGRKGTEVRLTVKKPDGTISVIPIIRDKIVLEETYVKSSIIIDEKNGKKWGYIYLPAFYHDFRNKGDRNSSDDVKKELDALTERNVDGIILDIRNNSGGALDDAIKMSGLFISNGPIVQVRNSEGEEKAFDDPDEGISYDGPLVVMINEFSASASEILAAALQDYGRAVIAGSERSFGKGTVQTLVELDNYILFSKYKPLGSVKLTIQKFYRITGGSTQQKGVSSDILFPSGYNAAEVGEKSLDNSLPWDTIAAQSFHKWNHSWNIKVLKQNSAERVLENPVFKLVNANLEKIKKESTLEPLQLSKAWVNYTDIRQVNTKMENIQKEHKDIKVSVLKINDDSSDPAQAEKDREWEKNVNKDVYIYEASRILADMAGK
jgi:carboxyl-terminal processing protease